MSSLIDLFDRFIVEHGSAPIHKEHIALLKDQAALFEKKMLLLESENRVLKAENERYKAENADLKDENVDVKNKLKAQEKPLHDHDLPEEQRQILFLLAKQSSMNEERIVAALSRGIEAIRFDLEEVKEMGLIEAQSSCGFTFWSLTQEGRRYMKNKGLLI